jgi:adenylate kinase family enzyme
MARVGPRRIVVVGTTGAGKTTLARQLAARLELPHIELDALHWDPGWAEAPLEVFRQRVVHALHGDAWVVDGNYGKARDLVWGRAELVVWLDYTLPLVLWRLLRRSLRRSLMREELWSGNRERLSHHFFSRDSLFVWALRTYRRRRVEIPMLFSRPEYAHLALVRLRSPREARRWLTGL